MELNGENQVRWYRWFFTFTRSWVAFILGMISLGALWYGCFWIVKTYCPPKYLAYFEWAAYVSLATVAVMLIFNEPIVKFATHAKRIKRREDCPKLWDAVHEVTPWHAKPTPRIYLLPSWEMNAISFGWGLPLMSAVGATEGLISQLTQEEVEAVMAHEVGHIINKDILVTMIMALAIMIVSTTGYFLFRFGPYSGSGRDRSSSSKSSGGGAIVIVIIIGLVMYLVGRLFGYILQAFVSRQREYAADATGSRIVGTSRPLRTALMKIVKHPGIGSEKIGAAAGFLCTADPEPEDVMATHPSLERRLRALENLEK